MFKIETQPPKQREINKEVQAKAIIPLPPTEKTLQKPREKYIKTLEEKKEDIIPLLNNPKQYTPKISAKIHPTGVRNEVLEPRKPVPLVFLPFIPEEPKILKKVTKNIILPPKKQMKKTAIEKTQKSRSLTTIMNTPITTVEGKENIRINRDIQMIMEVCLESSKKKNNFKKLIRDLEIKRGNGKDVDGNEIKINDIVRVYAQNNDYENWIEYANEYDHLEKIAKKEGYGDSNSLAIGYGFKSNYHLINSMGWLKDLATKTGYVNVDTFAQSGGYKDGLDALKQQIKIKDFSKRE